MSIRAPDKDAYLREACARMSTSAASDIVEQMSLKWGREPPDSQGLKNYLWNSIRPQLCRQAGVDPDDPMLADTSIIDDVQVTGSPTGQSHATREDTYGTRGFDYQTSVNMPWTKHQYDPNSREWRATGGGRVEPCAHGSVAYADSGWYKVRPVQLVTGRSGSSRGTRGR